MNIAQLKSARSNKLNLTGCEALITVAILGSMEMTRLARSIGISKAGLTPIADKLIESELIERIYGTDDRRVITLHVTPKGYAVVKQLGVKYPALRPSPPAAKVQAYADTNGLPPSAISLGLRYTR